MDGLDASDSFIEILFEGFQWFRLSEIKQPFIRLVPDDSSLCVFLCFIVLFCKISKWFFNCCSWFLWFLLFGQLLVCFVGPLISCFFFIRVSEISFFFQCDFFNSWHGKNGFFVTKSRIETPPTCYDILLSVLILKHYMNGLHRLMLGLLRLHACVLSYMLNHQMREVEYFVTS